MNDVGKVSDARLLFLFLFFEKQDALKIKMPEQVPPGVARAFEVLVPATITLIITACIGSACYNLTY